MAAAPVVVLTTSATIPGLRRLETTLALLPPAQQAVAAVLGPPRRKWPRALVASAGPATRALLRADRVVQVPFDATLATRGIDTAALPTALLAAAGHLLALTTDTTVTFGKGPAAMTHATTTRLAGLAEAICPVAPPGAQRYADLLMGYLLWGIGILFILGVVVGIGAVVGGRAFSMPHASKAGVVGIVLVFVAVIGYLVLPGIVRSMTGSGCV